MRRRQTGFLLAEPDKGNQKNEWSMSERRVGGDVVDEMVDG